MSNKPIVVIGAGVVGVMTAQALAARGARVLVIDRLAGPAALCSRANAGIMAVGHANAWAGPEAFGAVLRALAGREPSVRITRLMDPALWRWGLAFLGQCSRGAHSANTGKLTRLSRYSRDLLAPIEAEMGLPPETRHQGGLYLFQDQAQFEAHVASLQAHGGGAMEVLDRAALIAREPGLAQMSARLVGGLFSPADSVGDCHLFTTRASSSLAEAGLVEFVYDTAVTGFRRTGGRIEAVDTSRGSMPCSRVVLATGVETPELTRPLGFAPLIYPVKGYSGTWRITDPAAVPTLPFVDETELLAVARYGGHLRVTAIAEFAGHDRSLPEARTALLDTYVRRFFGAAVDLDTPQYWTGLRPTTPAGPPYLGKVRHLENLWINAGHGQLGWTMAPGCGALIARQIAGETPEISNVSAQARWLDAI